MHPTETANQNSAAKTSGTRITVTLPPDDYTEVRRIAKEKKVSASWVVRDAVERYVKASPEQ